MPGLLKIWLTLLLAAHAAHALGQGVSGVIDIPTRAGVTQRMLVLPAESPKAAVILFAGGHGGLQISAAGGFNWGANNFLVRSRELFAEQGLLVVVIDAPSDRQGGTFLSAFRQTPEHVADIRAVMAWLRAQHDIPVWLVGTSRGTQSAAYVATALDGPAGPDGLVLTATILTDNKSRPVPSLPLERLRIPVLVVHHEQDGCSHCAFGDMPALMNKLAGLPKQQLLAFTGGQNRGDPCAAMAYHGFNGLEREVVGQIAGWLLAF